MEISNGLTLDNMWEYLEKDYWDADDLKFDFWFRLQRHQKMIFDLLEKNGIMSNKIVGDDIEQLKKEIIEKNKKIIMVNPPEYDFDW